MSQTASLDVGRRVPYRLLAVATLGAHLAFVVLVVLGGFLAWAYPWVLWIHLPALVWGMAGQVRHLECPLTGAENWARARGGWSPLTDTGFIDHYLTGVLYPRSWKPVVPFVVLTVVLVSWVGLLLR
ncbi:MAG TPA: DUF2784 domain-containing protein [Ornithinicoccus sp.]|nr:DUF2784 domain-containing protein [Ornithinicoccus sp.]